ncbi:MULTISPECIES: PDDEXK nuclease domain-containing protein [Adlercreutzia]|uniref:PDDEXK nuclease domain-containing protein n=1 Tax=Adlercreutzia TaxID=447020 RepID=UPI0003F55CAC|nr:MULTISPECIES: PDDEXK nuclease domain-containing protein [Adlercreutzia]MCR2033901.1 PDDEXK nuclease domain-containing protein [Adlercreutzia mucosicola]
MTTVMKPENEEPQAGVSLGDPIGIPDDMWSAERIGTSAAWDRFGSKPHPSFEDLVCAVENAVVHTRDSAAQAANKGQLLAYWTVGKMIVVYEQDGSDRAKYGDRTLVKLAKRLTVTLGRGFSRTNLYYMRQFYLTHQIFQTVSGKLFWSHYCELLNVDDDAKRGFYEHETANAGWSVRELRRQMDSMLFERVINAKDSVDAESIKALACEGIAYQRPVDAMKSPVVLEFLDIPDVSAPYEGELQKALLAQIEKFMLELGRGFMFVGSNVRIPVGSDKDYADMVFYCKPLRAYVIIELKTTKFMACAVGQINEYLNYYATEVNDEYDNPPIGIILCTDKNNVRAEYALGGLNNAIFASTYTLRLPNEEQLIEQVRKTIEANEPKILPVETTIPN